MHWYADLHPHFSEIATHYGQKGPWCSSLTFCSTFRSAVELPCNFDSSLGSISTIRKTQSAVLNMVSGPWSQRLRSSATLPQDKRHDESEVFIIELPSERWKLTLLLTSEPAVDSSSGATLQGNWVLFRPWDLCLLGKYACNFVSLSVIPNLFPFRWCSSSTAGNGVQSP